MHKYKKKSQGLSCFKFILIVLLRNVRILLKVTQMLEKEIKMFTQMFNR